MKNVLKIALGDRDETADEHRVPLVGHPAGFVVWLVWLGHFEAIQNGAATLGLVALWFVWAMFTLHAPLGDVLRGLVPRLARAPSSRSARRLA